MRTTDELAALAAHIVARLDPDGTEPSDRVGKRRRHLTIGKLRDGSVPVRGELLPEVAAQLQKLVDSTHAQKRHDSFATVLMVAAASGGMPTLGGAAPTLVVSVTAEDFADRTGHTGRARAEGPGYDVPLGAADNAACAGGVQRVLFDEHGAIVAISTSARLFNASQRRVIVLRDRECLIPGCGIPAE